MQVFARYVSPRSVVAFALEMTLVVASLLLAVHLRGGTDDVLGTLWRIGVIAAICQMCFYYADLYNLTLVDGGRELVARLLTAGGMASLLLAAIYFAIPALILGDGIFVSSLAFFLVAIAAWRIVFLQVGRSRRLQERLLILGTGPSARKVAREVLDQHDYPYEVVGFIDDDPTMVGQSIVNPKVIGTPTDILRLVREQHIDRIVVGLTDRRGKLPIDELLQAKLSGVRVEETETIYERLTGKILLDDLKPSWLIFSDGFRARRLTRLSKRGIDVLLSVVGVVLAAPVMALTALAVRLDSRGPVLYAQERVGEHGAVFTLYKFRSMRADAEHAGTPIWAKDNDDRVTRVGRFIRLTRLDELPQLWNVLRGDMSFVGPRPERPFFVEQLAEVIPFYRQRHAVKPGVTGWAQVKYRYGASIEDAREKLRYDLYYIKHMSVVFDLTIVLDTVKVILLGKGAK
jgi:sugar transferase (PEP-CTERM system associated)